MQEFREARLQAPPFALVRVEFGVDGAVRALRRARTFQQALAQRLGRRQFGLLLDEGDFDGALLLQLAVVQVGEAGDDPQQGGLAGAVTADQAEPFARFHGKLRAIQERAVAKSQVGVEKCDECHELIVRIGRSKANTVQWAAGIYRCAVSTCSARSLSLPAHFDSTLTSRLTAAALLALPCELQIQRFYLNVIRASRA